MDIKTTLITFVKWNPLLSIIIFSAIITFLLTFSYKKFLDKKRYDELKEKQKKLQQKLKEEKDSKKLAAIQQEMMQDSLELMKITMKPTMITFIPLILIFAGLKWLYVDATQVGDIIAWGIDLPLIHTGAGWLLCYFIFGFVFSIIFKKILKT